MGKKSRKRKNPLANKTPEVTKIGLSKTRLLLIAVGLVLVLGAVFFYAYSKDKKTQAASGNIVIETTRGNIEMTVYPDLLPVTAANFDRLVRSKFYDDLTFHRVESWVVQGGDPNGNGTGGPGWTIRLETNPKLKNVRGAVAMARSEQPDSAGSQFYILKEDKPDLDGKYAVFGKVTSGMEIVDSLTAGDKMTRVYYK